MIKSRVAARSARPVRSTHSANRYRSLASATAQVAVGLLALTATQRTAMADLWWDINGTAAGASDATHGTATTAPGNWDAVTANWNTDASGGAGGAVQTWVGPTNAFFSAGTNATGTSSVTVVGTQTVTGITSEEGTISLTGGTLDFGSSPINITTGSVLSIASVITGTGAFTKGGASGLTLSGANTFSGVATISTGAVTLTGAGTLGTNTADIQVSTNAALNLNTITGGTYSHNITLGGGNAVLNNSGGTDTYTGIITLTNTSTAVNQNAIGATSGTLVLNTPDQIQGSGGSSFAGSLTKSGGGTLTINASQSKVTGPLYMTGFIMNISGGGALPNVGDMTLGMGAATTTTIDNSAANVTNRFNDNSKIIFTAGAELSFTGNSAATGGWSTNELVGSLVASNDSTLNTATNTGNPSNANLTLKGGSNGTTLSAASIIVQPGAMLNIRGTGIGTASNMLVVRDNGASLMVRGATGGTGTSKPVVTGLLGDTSVSGTGTDFVTFDSTTNSLAPLAAADYVNSITSGDTSKQNTSISTAQTVTANTTINSLKTTGSGSVTINPGSTLTLSSGMALFTVGTTVSGGTINVPTDTDFDVVARANSTISSVISGVNHLVKAGAGSLTLSGNNTYTGQTIVSTGTLVVTNSNALGDASGSTDVLRGASLQLAGNNMVIADPITLRGSQTGTVRGAVSNLTNSADVTAMPSAFVGGIDNASGNNTITGTITLAGAGTNIGDSALNTISVTSGSLTVSNSMQLAPGLGSSALAKTGPGVLNLDAPNPWLTITRLWGGTLVARADGAAGANVTGNLGIVQNQGMDSTFALQAPANSSGFTYNAQNYNLSNFSLTLGGWGHGNLGALDNLGGNNTFAGSVNLSAPSSLSTSTGDLAQVYLGVQSGSLTITGAVGNGGERGVTKIGSGNLILTGTLNMVGPFEVAQGSLTFAGSPDFSSFGNFASPTTVITWLNANSGTSVVFDNTNFNLNISGIATIGQNSPMNLNIPVNLFGAELKIIGSAIGMPVTMDFTQPGTYGKLAGWGMPTFTIVGQGSQTTITTPARVNRNTFLLRGMGDGQSQLIVGGSPALVGGGGSANDPSISILPFAIGDASSSGAGSDFVTFDSGLNSYRILSASEYAPLTDGNTTIVNAAASGATLLNAASTTINALKLTGASVAVGTGNTLNVNSGAILATGGSASTISGGTVAMGAAEGVVSAAAGSSLNVSSAISGTNGLTISGGGNVTLSGTNTFTGGLFLNAGTLSVSSDSNLGDASNSVSLGGGIFKPASSLASLSRAFSLIGRADIDLDSGQTFTLTGNITSPSTGNMSGALIKSGAGTLVLKGTNTYKGGTTITGGVLSIGSAASYPGGSGNGFAPMTIDGGVLQFTGSMTLSGAGTDGTPFGIQLGKNGGTIDVTGTNVVKWGANQTSPTPTAPMYGPGSLTKTGSGTWEFLGNSPNYAGGTYINGGTIQMDLGNPFPVSGGTAFNPAITINNTGRLLINNVTLSSGDVYLNNGSTLAGSGASATYSQAFGPQIAATASDGVTPASVTLSTTAAADVLTVSGTFGNANGVTSPVPTVKIAGAGTVFISANQSASFVSNFVVPGGSTLRLADGANPLGAASNTLTLGTNAGSAAVVQARVSATRTYGPYPVTINGPVTFNEQSTTANGGGSFVQTYGALTINGDQAIGLTHNPSGTGNNGITSGTLGGVTFGATTLKGSPTFNIANPAGVTTSAGRITLGTITESGGSRSITATGNGQLALGGGTITGTLIDQIGGVTGSITGGMTITGSFTAARILESGAGTLTVSGATAKLTLAANNPTSVLTTVPTFSGTAAELDVKNNNLVINYTGSTAAQTLRTALAGGSHFSAATPPVAAWNGQGIVSSSTGDSLHGLGYLEASDLLGLSGAATATWNGVTVDATSLLVQLAMFGDINMDGTVNRDDLALLDRGAALYGAGTIAANQATWLNGDANYDGKVDANDYLLTDISYAASGNPLSPDFLAQRDAQFGDAYVSTLLASVPEPTSLGIIGLVGAASLARRRRSR